jgi:hypothetical protein
LHIKNRRGGPARGSRNINSDLLLTSTFWRLCHRGEADRRWPHREKAPQDRCPLGRRF